MEFRSHYNLSLNYEYITHWFLKVSEKRREMQTKQIQAKSKK